MFEMENPIRKRPITINTINRKKFITAHRYRNIYPESYELVNDGGAGIKRRT